MTAQADVVQLRAKDEDNPFKLVARYRKARGIANKLIAHGASVQMVEELGVTYAGQTLAAEAAGVHAPSEGSPVWALVVELVKEAHEGGG